MDSIKFEIKDFEQPYITSKDTSEVSEETIFSGLESNLPGVNIEEYIWDFGDGEFMTGPEVSHIFKKEGIFDVRLGVKGESKDDNTSKIYCIMKPLWVTSAKKDP